MTTKNLRESENVVLIEGIVAEIRIEEKTFGDKEVITGEIDIKVKEDVHTVNVYANKFNKEGKESGLYKGFQTIVNDYKSIKTDGEEAADKVRIETGKIGLNEYVGQDGLFKSYPQLSANFINRLKPTDVFEPKAEFTLELFVAGAKEEVKNEEETGRAVLKGTSIGYEGRAIPVELVVEGKRAVDYVLNNYDKGTTVTVYGEVVNQVTVKKTEVEVGFGKPQEKIERKTVREYKVLSGTEPKDEDHEKAYDAKAIKKALSDREAQIEEKIEKKKNAPNNGGGNKSKTSGSKNPFADNGKPVDISEDELPF